MGFDLINVDFYSGRNAIIFIYSAVSYHFNYCHPRILYIAIDYASVILALISTWISIVLTEKLKYVAYVTVPGISRDLSLSNNATISSNMRTLKKCGYVPGENVNLEIKSTRLVRDHFFIARSAYFTDERSRI